MKYIKNFKIFESFNDEDIKISELEPYLVDFTHLGCTWLPRISEEISEIDFSRAKKETGHNFIRSSDIDDYSNFKSFKTLEIELSNVDIFEKINISKEQFSDAVNLLSDYLNIEFDLELYCIYIVKDFNYLFYPSVESLKYFTHLFCNGPEIKAGKITLIFR